MDRRDLRLLTLALAAAGALLAAVVIAFSALGGAVAFDDFPQRAGQSSGDETYVRSATTDGGPDSSSRSDRVTVSDGTGRTTAAPDADPVLSVRSAGSGKSGSESAGAESGTAPSDDGETGGGPGGSDPSTEPPGAPPPGSSPPAPSEPGTSPPDSAVPEAPAAPPTEAALAGGPITSTVTTLDGAAEEVTGVDPPIDEVATPVTEPIDEAVAGIAGD